MKILFGHILVFLVSFSHAEHTTDDILYDDNGKVQYAYFRMNNYDSSIEVPAFDSATGTIALTATSKFWNYTYSM